MYTTRHLSHYINFPESLSDRPEGPNSGYLVILDEESEIYTCCGMCKMRGIVDLPFPQNKNLTIRYQSGAGENSSASHDDVVFVPVLNLPLSSNRYYAIKPHGRHKGEAFTCSTEEDKITFCICSCIQDVKPRPLNPLDPYQQFQISLREYACSSQGHFHAKSVAPDGFPPYFLRRKGWEVNTRTSKDYSLGEAHGLNAALRARLPNSVSESVTIGKWYCPFMFVRERTLTLKEQMKRSIFYEMTLEQRWEHIYGCENYAGETDSVLVDVAVRREIVSVAGREAWWDDKIVTDGAIWYSIFGNAGEEISVGLSSLVLERMKWEQERGGWVGGEEREVKVKREEKFSGDGKWRRFDCYVLVEWFVLKRNDGGLVLAYDFNHTHQIQSKWE